MTTIADTIAETRSQFFTSYRPQVNFLHQSIDASETTLQVADPPNAIQNGADISVGLEVMRVRQIAGQIATVVRGWDGSTAAAHAADTLIWVNSQVTDWDIFRAVRNDLVDLAGNGIFRVTETDLTFQPTVQGYDIPVPGVLSVLDVRYRDVGPWLSWPEIQSYRFDPAASTSDFVSGQSLTIYEGGFPGQPIHVVLAVPFTPPTALTDDLQTTIHLPSTCNDLPPLGAAMRLAAGREIQRNFNESQGQPRRAEEVPAGANLGSFRDIVSLRQQRIVTEANRIKGDYPAYLKGRNG